MSVVLDGRPVQSGSGVGGNPKKTTPGSRTPVVVPARGGATARAAVGGSDSKQRQSSGGKSTTGGRDKKGGVQGSMKGGGVAEAKVDRTVSEGDDKEKAKGTEEKEGDGSVGDQTTDNSQEAGGQIKLEGEEDGEGEVEGEGEGGEVSLENAEGEAADKQTPSENLVDKEASIDKQSHSPQGGEEVEPAVGEGEGGECGETKTDIPEEAAVAAAAAAEEEEESTDANAEVEVGGEGGVLDDKGPEGERGGEEATAE